MVKTRSDITLPPSRGGATTTIPRQDRRIVIIGVNGAGKSLFMEEMIRLNSDKSLTLSPFSSADPEKGEIYRVAYRLLAEHLSIENSKTQSGDSRKSARQVSRLDRIRTLWSDIFPGSSIILDRDGLKFATTAGDDLIGIDRLSQGERTILFYAASILYAPYGQLIFIDSPSLFLHPSITGSFWHSMERLRKDCTLIFNSVDLDFIGSSENSLCIRIESFDSSHRTWEYDLLDVSSLPEDILETIAGNRKPILFIEGDSRHSIDAKLYSLVFPEWTVKPLGSCSKVIETTRTFNDMKAMHRLRSRGIVDRDRRTDTEVEYLRKKEILVPEVAEIENIFLLPAIIKVMAKKCGKNPEKVLRKVRDEVIGMFRSQADRQALQHVRHSIKREVECKIDARFTCITALETHLKSLVHKLRPREIYNRLRHEFGALLSAGDYEGILKVFNHKPMLPNSGIHLLLGYHSKDDYIRAVLRVLEHHDDDADAIKEAVRKCFRLAE